MKIVFTLAVAVVLLISFHGAPRAQARTAIGIHVQEPAGIPRVDFPTTARVSFQDGVLKDLSHIRLSSNGAAVPAQFDVESSYPDGFVQRLTVDFQVDLAPFEERTFQLEFGDGVEAGPSPSGAMAVEESAGVQVGRVRLGPGGNPLLASVMRRVEEIGKGPNGFSIVDTTGRRFDASNADNVRMRVQKSGPLMTRIRYTGDLQITSRYAVGYATTVELPAHASWIRITAEIIDPERRVKELSIHTPLSLGTPRWEWDFGGERGSGSAAVVQVVGGPQSTSWKIVAGETVHAAGDNVVGGWGYVRGEQGAVAFSVADFGAEVGTYAIELASDGLVSFRLEPDRPMPFLRLAVYENFVDAADVSAAGARAAGLLDPLVISLSYPR